MAVKTTSPSTTTKLESKSPEETTKVNADLKLKDPEREAESNNVPPSTTDEITSSIALTKEYVAESNAAEENQVESSNKSSNKRTHPESQPDDGQPKAKKTAFPPAPEQKLDDTEPACVPEEPSMKEGKDDTLESPPDDAESKSQGASSVDEAPFTQPAAE